MKVKEQERDTEQVVVTQMRRASLPPQLPLALTPIKVDVTPVVMNTSLLPTGRWGGGVPGGDLVHSSLDPWSPRQCLSHGGIKKIIVMMEEREGINE